MGQVSFVRKSTANDPPERIIIVERVVLGAIVPPPNDVNRASAGVISVVFATRGILDPGEHALNFAEFGVLTASLIVVVFGYPLLTLSLELMPFIKRPSKPII